MILTMKKIVFALCIVSSYAFFQTRNNDRENPELVSSNKEKPDAA
jgi:hypothetical protein